MPLHWKRFLLFSFIGLPSFVWASGLELFAKGSISKSYLASDKWTVSVSATTGLAIVVLPQIRIEGRYTNIGSLQNKMDVVSDTVIGSLTDIKTQTIIYTVGIDIDLLGEKSPFQPFIFVGGGYLETERSYNFTVANSTTSTFYKEPKQHGLSANLGVGFKLRIVKHLAFEVEGFAYSTDVDKPERLINLYGTAGIRIYI